MKVELASIALVALPFMGRPAFPFIGQGKGTCYIREREKGTLDYGILYPLYVGTISPVGDDADGTTPRACCHWCHASAPLAGHGAPFCPSGQKSLDRKYYLLIYYERKILLNS